MSKLQVENKIQELKEEIKKDEIMMEEDPASMFWCNDYDFNSSLLASYEKILEGLNL